MSAISVTRSVRLREQRADAVVEEHALRLPKLLLRLAVARAEETGSDRKSEIKHELIGTLPMCNKEHWWMWEGSTGC